MALVPNVPTDYDELLEDVQAGTAGSATLIARKSGKTPFDGALLALLVRIAAALEKSNA